MFELVESQTGIYDQVPVAVVLVDDTLLLEELFNLRVGSAESLTKHLLNDPDLLQTLCTYRQPVFVNEKYQQLTGCHSRTAALKVAEQQFRERLPCSFVAFLVAMFRGEDDWRGVGECFTGQRYDSAIVNSRFNAGSQIGQTVTSFSVLPQNRLTSVFASGVTHQLNNQMMVIQTYSGIARRTEDSDLRQESQTHIGQAVRRAAQISRILGKFGTPDSASTDAAQLLSDIVELITPPRNRDQLTLNVRTSETRASISQQDLLRILAPLLMNAEMAFKLSDGRVDVSIESGMLTAEPSYVICDATDANDTNLLYCSIRISDNSPGIPVGIMNNQIPDPDPESASTDCMSLSAVASAVVRNHGRLAATHSANGTEFEILLPNAQ